MRFALPFHSPKNSRGPSGTAGLTPTTYLSHFRLRDKPFDSTPDPRFLWLGRRLKRVLLQLRYEILRRDGWVVITGDPGSGKTTLAACLLNDLQKQVTPASVSCPQGGPFDLISLISSAFGLGKVFPDRDSFLAAFEPFLRESFSAGKKAVLILDDAERLASEHLAELAHLSDLGANDNKWLNLVLVGQNDFQQRLAQKSHRFLRPRIIFNFHLPPLTREETSEYVLHRMRIAREEETSGAASSFSSSKKEIFTSQALTEVYLGSRGIPRLINTLCDSALLTTFSDKGKKVLPQTVKKCAPQQQQPVKVAGWMRDGLAPRTEGKAEGEIRPPHTGFSPAQRIRKGPGKRTWAMMSWGAAGFLVVLGTFLFLFPQLGLLPQKPISPPSNEVSPKAAADAGGPKELIKQAIPSAGPIQALIPNVPPRILDSTAPKGKPTPPAKVTTPGKESPRSAETVKQTLPVPKTAARPVPEAPGPSQPKEKDFLVKGQEFLENGIAFSESKKGKIPQGPEPKAVAPDPTAREDEETDPGKAIEWLLERKGPKKE